ncbi:SMC-Scp complex subunit ScpB [Candidatus Saganbacteria bacterium]|nr:SMC-Scp complex subunit ScpB [Candidatus Saganbacteria bacterium]
MAALEYSELKKILEALLFVTKKPLSAQEISKITEEPEGAIINALGDMAKEFEPRGLKIITVAHGYILGTDSIASEYVDRMVNSKVEATLSPQSLETLAIIAYKQPVTKPEIETIRGLYSDGVLDTLLSKKLIEENGRSHALGRPILYGTTIEFLRHFGLKDLSDLPKLPEFLTEQENLFQTVLK